jgi:hypothetical protein
MPLAVYFYNFNGGLSSDHSTWAELGSYLGGSYGALAFVALIYTTNITRKQFKIQNEDSVFFKLYDSLQNRISIATISIDGKECDAHQLIKELANKFYSELSEESVEIARLLLAKNPESISDLNFMKIFQAINGEDYLEKFTADKESLIQNINSQVDFNSRWEELKNYIGSRGTEGSQLKDALRATGSVNFYKIPFSERSSHYKIVYDKLSIEYGEFLDFYFKNIKYLLKFASKSTNKDLYVNYFKSQLTKYELILLFYYIVGSEHKVEDKIIFLNLSVFDELLSIDYHKLMIDAPSKEIIKGELNSVFEN